MYPQPLNTAPLFLNTSYSAAISRYSGSPIGYVCRYWQFSFGFVPYGGPQLRVPRFCCAWRTRRNFSQLCCRRAQDGHSSLLPIISLQEYDRRLLILNDPRTLADALTPKAGERIHYLARLWRTF